MQLSFVRGLYDTPGPWASVYIDTTHDTQTARAALKIRWKDLRESLHEQGVDDGTLRSLDAEMVDERTLRALDSAGVEEKPHPGRHGLAMFAAQGEVRYAEVLSSPSPSDHAELDPLPHLTPLLVDRGEQVPWLLVLVDRVGADIHNGTDDVIKAEGSRRYPLRKTHGGGWSQENLHRAAEKTWQHNAKEVAREVDRLAEAGRPEVIVVAGDVRARQLLVDHLAQRWRDKVILTDRGARAPGADRRHHELVTAESVADTVARRTATVVDRLLRNGAESAAFGVRAVGAAFARHQVDTLVIDPERVALSELWTGLDPSQVAGTEEELRQLSAGPVHRVRAEDALVRAAAHTDAEFILVSPDDVLLDDGVGAVLRYVDPATVRG